MLCRLSSKPAVWASFFVCLYNVSSLQIHSRSIIAHSHFEDIVRRLDHSHVHFQVVCLFMHKVSILQFPIKAHCYKPTRSTFCFSDGFLLNLFDHMASSCFYIPLIRMIYYVINSIFCQKVFHFSNCLCAYLYCIFQNYMMNSFY